MDDRSGPRDGNNSSDRAYRGRHRSGADEIHGVNHTHSNVRYIDGFNRPTDGEDLAAYKWREDRHSEIEFFSGANIRWMVGVLWRRKLLFALVTFACVAIVALRVYSEIPRYTASATIYFSQERSQVVDIESVVATAGPISTALIQSEMEVIRSQALLDRVVEQLSLMKDSEFNAALRHPPPQVFADPIEIFKNLVALVLPPREFLELIRGSSPGTVVVQPAATEDTGSLPAERVGAINALQSMVDVEPVGRSLVLRILVETSSGPKSARIANSIANQYIVDQLEAKFEATTKATEWLSDRVVKLRERVEQSETTLEELKASPGYLDEDARLRLTNSISASVRRRDQAKDQFDRLEAQIAELRAVLRRGDVEAMGELATTRGQLVALQAFQDLASRGANSEDLEAAGARLKDTFNVVISQLEREQETLASRIALLDNSIDEFRVEARSSAAKLVELRQLEREAEATRLLYEAILARAKETSTQQGLEQANARILEQAQVPKWPSSPKRRLAMLLGALFGFVLSLGIIFLLERLRSNFRDSRELEEATGLPVLGQLPIVENAGVRKQVIEHSIRNVNSPLAESVRFLRTAISLANVDRRGRSTTVLLSSSVPAEGKSTTALLLAHSSAQLGSRAVIVDCDLRRPSLQSATGLPNASNVLSVVSGETPLEEAIVVDERTGLSILLAARSAVNAADLLSSESFRRMLGKLQSDYDLVVIDAPPALAVPDAKILSQLCDVVIHVVKWDETPRDAVRNGLKVFYDAGVRVSGVVLTMIDPKKQSRYSYGYSSYGYTYRQNKKYYQN